MAAVPRNSIDADKLELVSEPVAKRPKWYAALADHPAWKALEAEAGDLLSYAEDRLTLGRGADPTLAGEVHRVSRILLGSAGWRAEGDHIAPFSLLITLA